METIYEVSHNAQNTQREVIIQTDIGHGKKKSRTEHQIRVSGDWTPVRLIKTWRPSARSGSQYQKKEF